MNRQNPSTAGPFSFQTSPSAAIQRTSGRHPLLKHIQKLDGLGAHFSTPALSDDANLHSEPQAQVLELPGLAPAPLAEVNLNTMQVR